jgi:hypothetical protein
MTAQQAQKIQDDFALGVPDQIRQILQNTPFSPPDGSVQGLTIKALGLNANQKANAIFVKKKIVNNISKIAFVKFVPLDQAKKGAVGIDARDMKYGDELRTTVSRTGYLPIWWLPWDGRGSLVKTKILDIANHPTVDPNDVSIDPLPNPPIFITAALSGCSVFAYGDARGPSVYHGGYEGRVMDALNANGNGRMGNTPEEVWRNLFNGAVYLPESTGDPWEKNIHKMYKLNDPNSKLAKVQAGIKAYGEVGKSQYVTQFTSTGETHLSRQFQKWLMDANRDRLAQISVSAWGAVLGIRSTAGIWSFYLQRNASIAYQQIQKSYKGHIGKIKWGEQIALGPTQRQNICMGLQKFFPDRGSITMNDLTSIQLV